MTERNFTANFRNNHKGTAAPMAPYQNDEGYVYVRVPRLAKTGTGRQHDPLSIKVATFNDQDLWYVDDEPGATRIASARRVERAMQVDDYLRLCESRGWRAVYSLGAWSVAGSAPCKTLAEAYHKEVRKHEERKAAIAAMEARIPSARVTSAYEMASAPQHTATIVDNIVADVTL